MNLAYSSAFFTLFSRMLYRFKEGQENVNKDAHPGCPSTSTTDGNNKAMNKMILDNRKTTIREGADKFGIQFSFSQAIFRHVLDMKRASAKIIPKLLNYEQKQYRIDIAQEILTTFIDDLIMV